MNFILVNGRTPIRRSACALCGKAIEGRYLRETGTHLYYCDRTCYSDHCKRVMNLAVVKKAALAALAPCREPSVSGLLITTDEGLIGVIREACPD